MSSATYHTLLRLPGAAAFFCTATAGRIGIAMTSLGIVWLVHDQTGSYAVAGLVTGGFAVAEAVMGPQVARLIDRYGQPQVLPPVLIAHAAAVATLLGLVTAGVPSWLMTAGGVAVGTTIPQLGALSAARWAALLRDRRKADLPTAFALESMSNGIGYLVGPALVSALGAFGHPVFGSCLAAALIVGGGLALAAQRRTAPPAFREPAHAQVGRSLLRKGFVVLIGLNLAIGIYFGAIQVSVTAFAVEHGVAEAASPIFAVSSCSGLLAGWLYGLRRWGTPPRAQLALVAVALAGGALLLQAADSPLQLGLVIVFTGAAIPPMLVLFSVLTESTVDHSVLTQAFTWLNSCSAAGAAVAAAVAGQAVDAFDARGGFAVAAAAATVLATVAVAGIRSSHE